MVGIEKFMPDLMAENAGFMMIKIYIKNTL
jgi:hypothetical protein